MDKPLVSVIMPTWNRASIIEDAIRSVLNQTYENLELLICDDGSVDNTHEVIQAIDDERIKWIPAEKNSGKPSIPKNRGIQECKGEWIAFLDSDDQWLPDKLELQINAANNQNLKASCTNARRIVNGIDKGERFIFWNKPAISFSDLFFGNLVINSSAMFHRSLLDIVIGFPEYMTIAEDYALWLRVATFTDFAYVDYEAVKYYDEPTKSVRKEEVKIQSARKNVFSDYENWVSETNVPEARDKKLNLLSNLRLSSLFPLAVNVIKKLSR
ncbi:MAG: glycosyltransferase [Chlorobi bacterium]|nr:glycosyltransferase [Chlorobiota bacterium]